MFYSFLPLNCLHVKSLYPMCMCFDSRLNCMRYRQSITTGGIWKEAWFCIKEDFFSVQVVVKMQPSFGLLRWAKKLLDVVLPHRRMQQNFIYICKFCKEQGSGRGIWNLQAWKYLEEFYRGEYQINAPLA